MATDISKTTITILLVLTILVSVFGTWITLESLSTPSPTQIAADHPVETGSVTLQVREPSRTQAEGMVTLKIEGGEKNG